jgi:hypothetical protein
VGVPLLQGEVVLRCCGAEAPLSVCLPVQQVTNLAWGLAAAGCFHVPLLRKLRAHAGDFAGSFRAVELMQLHQADLAIRLEASWIGQPSPTRLDAGLSSICSWTDLLRCAHATVRRCARACDGDDWSLRVAFVDDSALPCLTWGLCMGGSGGCILSREPQGQQQSIASMETT